MTAQAQKAGESQAGLLQRACSQLTPLERHAAILVLAIALLGTIARCWHACVEQHESSPPAEKEAQSYK